MTVLGRLVSYVPLFVATINLWSFALFCADPSVFGFLWLIFTLYLLAPIGYRVHDMFRPLNEGVSTLSGSAYSPWRAARAFQQFYSALPFLEAFLRSVPGLYSAWLRLWGAHVGYGVHWPARIDIADRSLLTIGNRVVFSERVELSSHIVRMRGGEMRVLVKRVHVGDRAFLGVGVRMGPGARAPKDAIAADFTEIAANQTLGGETRHATPEEAEIAVGPQSP